MNRIIASIAIHALMGVGLLAVTADAGTLPRGKRMDFGTNITGGTFTYPTGIGQSMTVKNAPITWIEQAPSDKLFKISGGTLDLTTGTCYKGCSYNSKAQGLVSLFNNGGTVSVYGTVLIPKVPLADDPTGLLFQGTFDSSLGSRLFQHKVCPVTNMTLSNKGAKTGGFDGCVEATFINPTLLDDLNFPVDGSGQGYLSELFFGLTFSGSQFGGGVKSTDFNVVPAPEPSTLMLFGSALLIAAGFVRRKWSSQ